MRIKAIIIASLIALQYGGVACAQNSATIQAVVPDLGQGTGDTSKKNVSRDLTLQFESRYGTHTESDMISSDLLMWAFLLFVLSVTLYMVSDADRYVHKHSIGGHKGGKI